MASRATVPQRLEIPDGLTNYPVYCIEAYVYCIHSTKLYNLQVRMSTSCVVIHYIGWGCQAPNTRKYTVINGNFVSDLRDFDFRDVFREFITGVKRDLPVHSHYSLSPAQLNFVYMMHCISFCLSRRVLFQGQFLLDSLFFILPPGCLFFACFSVVTLS